MSTNNRKLSLSYRLGIDKAMDISFFSKDYMQYIIVGYKSKLYRH